MGISLSQRVVAALSSLLLLAGAGCATQSPAARSGGCDVVLSGAPAGALTAASGGALPGGILAVSAVSGTRQAWAICDRVGSQFDHQGYLLHFSGAGWVQVLNFRPWVDLAGVSAMSGRSAWVWGRSYLALVSGGVVSPLRSPWLKGADILAVASDGTTDTWVVGENHAGSLAEHWDGRSWRRTALPAGTLVGWPFGLPSLSTDGQASAWMVVGQEGRPTQVVVHWNGRAWSRSYAPSARLYGGNFGESGPDQLSVAASGGRAWVVYTEERVPKGVIAEAGSPSTAPAQMLSAFFDGSRWTPVRVPGRPTVLSQVAMSGPDAWALALAHSSPAILCSHLGGPWQKLPVPRLHRRLCPLGLQLDISPPYLIQASSGGLNECGFAYGRLYDGHHWHPVRPG